MAEFSRKVTSNGQTQYRNVTENKLVSADSLAPALKEELDLVDEGTKVSDEGMTNDTSSTTDADGNKKGTEPTPPEEEETPAPKRRQSRQEIPSTEEGMGFPRKNGKTVDLFDGKTVHTHSRYVDGIIVPLSEKSYNEKSDAEIHDKLVELKMVPADTEDESEDEE